MPIKTLLLAAGAGFLFLTPAPAQSVPTPRLAYVSPSGGQLGSTFEFTATGSDVAGAEGLHFSFPGVKVEVVPTSASVEPAETKKKGKKDVGPQTSQKFKVTLPAKVPLGIHDVRVITKGGVSNPRAFVVSDMKQIVETEPNDNVDKAQKVDLNTGISGVITAPIDVDFYRFIGKKGQRVLMSCLTTSIDSKLPVQLELYSTSDKLVGANRSYQNNDALLDVTLPEDGAYLLRVSSFTYTQGGPDYFYHLTITIAPWIDAIVPAVVQAGKDATVTIYGRNLPGGVAEPAAVVDGKTLEKCTVTLKAPKRPLAWQRLAYHGLVMPNASALDGFEYRCANDSGTSNPYLVGFARGPVTVDNEKNGTPETAQPVQVPGAIAGRIQSKGDRDYYTFTAKKGQVLHFDLLSDRLGAPTDLSFELFTLKDGKPVTITKQEDTPDNFGIQFPTPSNDPPSYRFVAPADGTYYVLISSPEAYSQFGPRHVYTLNITEDQPDFRLIAMPLSNQFPESVTLAQAGHQAYALFIWRLRGFSGDITLSGKLLPGVSMKPQVIAGNQKQAAFVVSAAPDAPVAVGAVKIAGSAVINGQKVVREVRGATITWGVPQQQNIPMIARLDRELVLAVRGKAPFQLDIEKDKVAVLQGDKLTVPVKIALGQFKDNVSLVAEALPIGMVMQPLTVTSGKDPVQAQIQRAFELIGLPVPAVPSIKTVQAIVEVKSTVAPGNYTLVLRGQTQDPKGKPPPPAKPGGPVNIIEAAPPLAVTVVPRQLAKLITPANLKVTPGDEVELQVRIEPQFGYTGSFKLEVVVPPNAKGLTALPANIEAGKNEATLIIDADPEAVAGQTHALVVRATALFNDMLPVVQEAKVNVVVTK